MHRSVVQILANLKIINGDFNGKESNSTVASLPRE